MDLYLFTLLAIVLPVIGTDVICVFMLYKATHHGTIDDVYLWVACIVGLSAVLSILLACIALNIGA